MLDNMLKVSMEKFESTLEIAPDNLKNENPLLQADNKSL